MERIVRRHSVELGEISRKVGVSRRTLYNWFEKEDLGMNDIMKVSLVINYNFLNEFPSGVYEISVPVVKIRKLKRYARTAHLELYTTGWRNTFTCWRDIMKF